MKKMNSYMAVLFAVVLFASPFWQADAVVEQAQGCCCSDMGEESCCSNPDAELPDNSEQADDDCTCKISTLPFLPDEPLEMLTNRIDHQPDKIKVVSESCFNKFSLILEKSEVMNNSPPPGELVASFIQYSVLLI